MGRRESRLNRTTPTRSHHHPIPSQSRRIALGTISLCLLAACAMRAPATSTTPAWLVIGQSNVEALHHSRRAEDAARRVRVQQYSATVNAFANTQGWTLLSRVPQFSAVGGAFGMALAERTGHDVYIAAAGWGGTTIDCWLPGHPCFDQHVSRFLAMPLAGVLWWQGEGDAIAQTPPETYGQRLRTLIETIRARNQQQTPFIIIALQKYCANWPQDQPQPTCLEYDQWEQIRQQQRAMVALSNVKIVEAYPLTEGHLHPIYSYDAIGRAAAQAAASLLR